MSEAYAHNLHRTEMVKAVKAEPSVLSAYYELTKPGITKMVVMSTAVGYYLAVDQFFAYMTEWSNVFHFILTIIGTSLVCAGSSALNHYLEREQDSRMQRTKNRPLPSGIVEPQQALAFGIALSVLGLVALFFINVFTVFLALLTLVSYVVIYTPLKQKSTLSLLVGAIPGALPTLGGWVAVRNEINAEAIILFLILFFWQMPHFLALSWMYKADYERGGFKMAAVLDESGKKVAIQAIVYCAILVGISILLKTIGATGYLYLAGTIILGGIFLYSTINFLKEISVANARKVLLTSYAYLMGVFVLIFVDKV
ncbi:MAG: heme o synthase [Bacteroidota bacterium]